MSGPDLRLGCLAMDPVATRRQWLDTARQAEDRGFTTLQVSDHFDRTPLAPLLALSAAAQVTTMIRLGTLVLDNDFRAPAVLAKQIATCDLLCDGRLEVGLGAGWLAEDYRVSGIRFDPPGQRISRLAETVRILKAVLGGDGPATVVGEHHQINGLRGVPASTQRPHPPLLIGGGGRRMLTLAARQGDIVGVNLMNGEGLTGAASARSAYEDAVDAKVGIIRAAAGAAALKLPIHMIVYWAEVTEHPAEAIERKVAQVGIPVSPERVRDSPHCLVGPLGQLVERVAQMRERWGFSYLTFYQRDVEGCLPLINALAGGGR